MTIITLTTDFGLRDGYVGMMKGVIWQICPAAQLVDISHQIAAHNILEAAYTLWRAYSFFPPGTIHLAVVDPGVGSARRPLAMRLGDHYFVGPDNGLFTPILDEYEQKNESVEMIHLINQAYWLPKISQTFHGRDVFAPVAAHLACGVPLENFGPALSNPVRIPLMKPEQTADGWLAHILWIDAFGNLATDIPARQIADRKRVCIRLAGYEIQGLVSAYGEGRLGELIALENSVGLLEIAVRQASAAERLQVKVGEAVEICGR